MIIGTTPEGTELAKRANESEARRLAGNALLEKIHIALYFMNAGQLALLMIHYGSPWLVALPLAPVLALFGPRYCSLADKVWARLSFAVLCVVVWFIAPPHIGR